MKLSLSWLSDYVDLSDIPLEDLVHRLTMSTCEVEEHFETLPFLGQLIVAEVRTCEKHPDSDHLSKCTVFDGKTDLSVICGAANVRAGIHVAFAPVGAVLPLKEGGELRLERRKIRGVLSEGMICSAKELQMDGILGDNGGIIILEELQEEIFVLASRRSGKKKTAASASRQASSPTVQAVSRTPFLKPGIPLTELFPWNDTILDIDNKSITHRPDLWCHFGFAREIAAVFRRKLQHDPIAAAADPASHPETDTKLPKKTIQIEQDSNGPSALAYHGMNCAGVRIAPAPLWMRLRLQAIGQKCINNVVDASNYVMFELGQPNHCFDAEVLKHESITCAPARKPLGFTALDGETYEIPPGAVLIYDGESGGTPVALGGVIGGGQSAIQDTTTRVFIESATFPRDRIRRALSAGAPRTESARRFEKGQDPSKAVPAVYRIVELIGETSPEIRCGKLTEAWAIDRKPRHNKIRLSLDFLRRRLGFELKKKELHDILGRLHFEIKDEKGEEMVILVPSFRSWHDVHIPEDIVEEVGRIYGYDNITPVPAPVSVEEPIPNLCRRFERLLKDLMIQQAGFDETMNYSFAAAEENRLFGLEGITLKNPVQAERDQMRVSQIPGLAAQAAANQDRFARVSLFEFGRVFIPRGRDLPEEPIHLTILRLDHEEDRRSAEPDASGPERTDGGQNESALAVFLDVRRRMEEVLGAAGIPFTMSVPKKPAFYLHPGCQVEFSAEGRSLGIIGLMHPAFARSHGIKKRVAVLGDFLFDELFVLWNKHRRLNHYRPPSVHPWSAFDLTLLLEESTSTADPVRVIESLGFPELRGIEILTIYRGEQVPPGKMAASYRVTVGSDEAGIKHERQQEMLARAVQALTEAGLPLKG